MSSDSSSCNISFEKLSPIIKSHLHSHYLGANIKSFNLTNENGIAKVKVHIIGNQTSYDVITCISLNIYLQDNKIIIKPTDFSFNWNENPNSFFGTMIENGIKVQTKEAISCINLQSLVEKEAPTDFNCSSIQHITLTNTSLLLKSKRKHFFKPCIKEKQIKPNEKDIIDIPYTHNSSKSEFSESQQLQNWMKENGDTLKAYMFTNLEYIGHGDSGFVMKCNLDIDGLRNYTIALKMVKNTTDLATHYFLKDIANECSILSELHNIKSHPNILNALAFFCDFPTPNIKAIFNTIVSSDIDFNAPSKKAQFYVSEFYNETLKSKIRTLSQNEILTYAIQFAKGLIYLKDNNIVHLDIKTNNIMISSLKKLVIIDFGSAGKLLPDGTVNCTDTKGGNFEHLAPEVVVARKNNKNLPCSKQHSWELGMLLYEMLSKGDLPFDSYKVIIKPISPELVLTHIPINYHYLLQKLLCNQEERLQIHEALTILENIKVNELNLDLD